MYKHRECKKLYGADNGNTELNKVALKAEKADVILFNPQPNVYLKKSEEMRLGLHHSRSISLLSLRNFFRSCAAIVLVSTGTHLTVKKLQNHFKLSDLMYISLKGP